VRGSTAGSATTAGGAGLGVRRQEADCRQLVVARGWSVVDVFSDNGLSAYSGKPRPDYQRLVEALGAGELDAVVAWHPDRLHRAPEELEELIRFCDESSVKIETVQAGVVDLSTPSGRLVARLLGSAARYESEHKADRIRRKARELAEAGRVSGGGTRPFGYEADRRTIREPEADIVRGLAARFLAGESLASLTRWLNQTQVPSVAGRGWRVQTVRRLLMSARISGQREHHGQIVATPSGLPSSGPTRPHASVPYSTTPAGAPPALRAATSSRGYCVATGAGTTMVARPREDGSRR
jgi:site-specific DNA recombinase